MDSTKHCKSCGQDKPLDDFGFHCRKYSERYRYCRDCQRLESRANYRKRVTLIRDNPPASEKRCPDCKAVKSAKEFYRDRSRPDGLQRYCAVCHRARKVARLGYELPVAIRHHWRDGQPTPRERNLKTLYGLTLDDFDRMSASQDHRCVLCFEVKRLCVDHCHESGQIRGLLCISCNSALGKLFGDDVGRFAFVKSYFLGGFPAVQAHPVPSVR